MRRRIPPALALLVLILLSALTLTLPHLSAQPAPAADARPPMVGFPQSSAVFEVSPPDASPAADALWQRRIATYAAKVRLHDVLQRTLDDKDVQAIKARLRPEILTVPGLDYAIHVYQQPPTTALIVLEFTGSDDPAATATVTRALARSYLAVLKDAADEAAATARSLVENQRRSLHDQLSALQSQLDDFITTHDLDTPLPTTAPAKDLKNRAIMTREAQRLEASVAECQSHIDACARQLDALNAQACAPAPIRLIQSPATPTPTPPPPAR